MKFRKLSFLSLLVFSLSACTTVHQIPSDVALLKSEVSTLQQELARIEEINNTVRKEVANLNLRMDDANTHVQEIRGQTEELQFVLQKRIKNMEERLALLEKGKTALAYAPHEPIAPGQPPPSAEFSAILDAEEPYAAAYTIYKERRYAEARTAFKKFLQQFPLYVFVIRR